MNDRGYVRNLIKRQKKKSLWTVKEAGWLSGQSLGFEYGTDLGSNPQLGLPNGFDVAIIPIADSPRFVNSQLVCLLPDGILNWNRGGF